MKMDINDVFKGLHAMLTANESIKIKKTNRCLLGRVYVEDNVTVHVVLFREVFEDYSVYDYLSCPVCTG